MVWRHHGKDRKLDTQERENMTKLLIALPCTARELENALHAVCDHDGLWGAKVHIEEVFEPISDAPSYVSGITHKRITRLVIETETKGESK